MAEHNHLVGVIYDRHTLAIKRIVIDARNLFQHVGPDEELATDLRMHGHSLERAFEIVRLATGREPLPMHEAHRNDELKRSMGLG
jgi:hypothetical protein